MTNHVYALDELGALARRIARAYGSPRLGIFGSYARGEATQTSDIDLYIDRANISAPDCFALAYELERATGKEVDLATSTSVAPGSSLWSEMQQDMVMLS